MKHPTELAQYLQPSRFIDSDHPAFKTLVAALVNPAADDAETAQVLYRHVRDTLRYDPYNIGLSESDYHASNTLAAGSGWCVSKALVLAAVCRAAGIPARVGYADVRNHLSTERLREAMQTDVFYFHGYTSLYLNGRWVKATPAFNIELCTKLGLHPLEFDGSKDSLYHEFDLAGNRHMEYLHDRGEHLDLPFEEMMEVMHLHYPALMATHTRDTALTGADWDADVAREVHQGTT